MPENFKAEAGDRRADLESLRQLLVTELDDDGHQRGCECDCGSSARDGRVLAALSAELRRVNLELEKLPGGEAKSDLDRIADRAEDELAKARAAREASGRGAAAPAAKRPRVRKDAGS